MGSLVFGWGFLDRLGIWKWRVEVVFGKEENGIFLGDVEILGRFWSSYTLSLS